MKKLVDSYNRHINYLRISITDRCNLRCTYCMPLEGVSHLAHEDILSYEEILHIARIAVKEGIKKIRVTGGEPLVRKGIVNFIKWLKPEILNISKFTPRPGTKAKKMEQLDSKIIKKRSIRLSKIFRNSLSDMNKKWNGWQGEVLILHKGTKLNQAFGRNFAYKNVFVENYNGEFGKIIKVKIEKVDGFNLFGRII